MYYNKDNVVSQTEGQELNIVLGSGGNRIVGTMSMPGFLPITDDVRFSMESVVFGIETDRDLVSARQNEMDQCDSIRFYITDNGTRLSSDDAMRYELTEPVITGGTLEYSWMREEDGSYVFRPSGKTESVGTLTVTTSLEGLPTVLEQLGTMQLSKSVTVESLEKIAYAYEAVPGRSDGKTMTARQNELDACEPVFFYLTADGVRVGAKEASRYVVSEPVIEGGMFEYQWYFDEEQGCYVFQPAGETEDTGEMKISVACEELEAAGEISLTVLPKISYGITGHGGEDVVLQSALGSLAPITFYLTADGVRMTKEEVEALNLKCSSVFEDSVFFLWETGGRKAGIGRKVKIQEDGSVTYQPRGVSWFYGDVTVTLSIPGEAECQVSFTIGRNMWMYWIPLIALCVLLFLIWCIIGWIRQPKFHNQIMEIVVYTKFGVGIQESPRIKVMKHRVGLIPWKACRMRVGDMVFVAGANRKILVDKDCLRHRLAYAGKVRFMGRNASNMSRLLRMMEPTKRDIRLVRGMELYVADDKNSEAVTGYRLTSN